MSNPIAFLADQLLPGFIPKDAAATTLTFQFTMVPNTTYRVNYVKTQEKGKAVWTFTGYELVEPPAAG
ncbi:hypothetical protein BDD43_5143 [Mucilaginibacter gracilis]|uniref:Uncharacterized protein n=1 Tax=Mucilaginibacter gracilis TaxID=423350 RepID=A0A495J7C3_9SPHI|nr:hypothetical protein [Mucilaginibacter gracilis]RKR84890.1 hypothetical protein BDD43_5143 [Mucilaginibacter gracilis]